VLSATLLLLLAGGCTTTRQPVRPAQEIYVDAAPDEAPPPPRPKVKTNTPGAPAVSPLVFDPCADRLHDEIAGLLLQYFALHKHLPPTLDELASIASAGEELDFTCPVSHKPYVYVPQGLVGVGTDRRLYVYDAVPAHGGLRWGLVSDPQGDLKVVPMDEQMFRKFAAPSRLGR
jgi:hypothetical protein